MHGAEHYFGPEEEAISFFQLMARARAKYDVIVIGYLERGAPLFPISNPPKKADR